MDDRDPVAGRSEILLDRWPSVPDCRGARTFRRRRFLETHLDVEVIR
jgi:hypothetical protein